MHARVPSSLSDSTTQDLEHEARLATLKLNARSWASSALMRGKHGPSGRPLPPTTAAAAPSPRNGGGGDAEQQPGGAGMPGAGLFSSTVPQPIRLPRIFAPPSAVALSRAPSFRCALCVCVCV